MLKLSLKTYVHINYEEYCMITRERVTVLRTPIGNSVKKKWRLAIVYLLELSL
jgi:hypothetical protein